jgi:hypothetical protein
VATKKSDQNDEATTPAAESPTSPLVESIDDRQLVGRNAPGDGTEDDGDVRDGGDQPNPSDNPVAPDDESAVVDPSDPMTLTSEDSSPR